jgi:hypothetical protein
VIASELTNDSLLVEFRIDWIVSDIGRPNTIGADVAMWSDTFWNDRRLLIVIVIVIVNIVVDGL